MKNFILVILVMVGNFVQAKEFVTHLECDAGDFAGIDLLTISRESATSPLNVLFRRDNGVDEEGIIIDAEKGVFSTKTLRPVQIQLLNDRQVQLSIDHEPQLFIRMECSQK